MLNLFCAGSLSGMVMLFLFVVCFIPLIMQIINECRISYKKERTNLWDYKFYKSYKYLMDSSSTLLLRELVKENYTREKRIELINSFNSLDSGDPYKITLEMVDFEKKLLAEKEPARKISESKDQFVSSLRHPN